jgi:hypothetical protein
MSKSAISEMSTSPDTAKRWNAWLVGAAVGLAVAMVEAVVVFNFSASDLLPCVVSAAMGIMLGSVAGGLIGTGYRLRAVVLAALVTTLVAYPFLYFGFIFLVWFLVPCPQCL